MGDIPAWVGALSATFLVAATCGSAFAVYRGASNKARAAEQHDRIIELQGQVSALATAYEAADRALEFERRERDRERESCRLEVATLTGQVKVLQDSVVTNLVESIKVAVAAALAEVLGRTEKPETA